MSLESNIRKLARSSFYQNIYRASKDLGGIDLFENRTNFSGPQFLFLYWLQVYSMLYEELGQKEHDVLTKDVIDNDRRCNAFLYYREKEYEKKLKEYKDEQRKSKVSGKNKGKKDSFEKFPVYTGPLNKGDS